MNHKSPLGLPRPVWLLGWASLFTDAATEMIYPLLPVYLSRVLGAGAMSLGVIEGIAEGVNSLLKILSGRLSDRWSRRKPIIIAGYALSSAARPFLALTTSCVPEDRHARRATASGVSDGPGPSMQPAATKLPGRFYGLLGILLLFSLANSADAFLLLRLSQTLGEDAYIPLLWSLLHIVKASLSMYGGALSDRVGRKGVIVAGWSVYALVYLGFAFSTSATPLVAWFLIYGIYFGLSEGTEKALVADLAPSVQQGTAFGFYNAALGLGTLVASVLFGVLYERFGPATAFGAGAGLAVAASLLLLTLPVGGFSRADL